MARTQRIALTDAPDTYTVLGCDGLPIGPAEEYLQFLRDDQASPNTVKAYAAGLASWWKLLEHTGVDWREVSTALFGQFLVFLRSADLPGTARIGEPEGGLSPASVQLRAAAVLAFYRYHADAHGLAGPYQRLFTTRGSGRRSRYVPMLAGVGPARSKPRPVYTMRRGNKDNTPVLTPGQVSAILDGCATQSGQVWSGPASGLRDRLLFAVMAETGMRLGEALSLRHYDIHIGAGGTPFVDVAARQDHPRGVRGKTLLARRIYIGDDLEALYSSYVWHLVDMGADVDVPDLDRHFVFVNLVHGVLFAPMRPETVYAKVNSVTRRSHGVLPGDWSPHWLRHTHATALLLSGAAPHVVMRRLGHADIQTTLSTYGWVTEDAEMRTLGQWKNYVAGWKGLHE
ncbi:tyrosine-type recombinase/integrase [Mycolicibacter longobardus]|uniref:Transposase n=1 Tax=Mycolicibacter longobardus TaxID=1108812 RepID=A0A1X1YAK1_9MYCO|nr:tyrosine-type recombinase/integrase [Mycolicibacter longobardus]ORW08118.1 transposase [Mycolicibacter longobardus]